MSRLPVRTIAILQIAGGAFTFCYIAWSLVTQLANIASGIIGIVELLIDIAAVVAGITLWRGTSFGRKASLAIQFIQLPKVTSPAIIFLFTFGFDVWVHASPDGLVGIQFSVFNHQLFLNVPNAPVNFGISITAIIALVILKKYVPEPRTAGPLPPPPPTDWSDEGAPNKSLDASGGSVFLNLIHPAMLD
jgi:hypothetical protein